jgi:hypothetical protein
MIPSKKSKTWVAVAFITTVLKKQIEGGSGPTKYLRMFNV